MQSLSTRIGLLAASLAVGCAPGGGGSAAALSTSHGGRDLADWMEAYWRADIVGSPDADGDVTFLPLPDGSDPDGDHTYTGELSTHVATGQTSALPLFGMVGESYDDGTPADVADDYATRDVFVGTGAHARLMLDGTVLFDTAAGDDPTELYYDTPFAPVVTYTTPTDYHADAAVWARGLGVLIGPMTAGTHTLHLVERLDDVPQGYDNVWTITVP
jgi:hypothetical protein